jgi:hypothetical protein
MGPIVCLTALKPYELKGMKEAQIRKRGRVSTDHNLMNEHVNQFIFVTRANEMMDKHTISKNQNEKIEVDVQRKVDSSKHLHSLYTVYSDYLLQERRKQM